MEFYNRRQEAVRYLITLEKEERFFLFVWLVWFFCLFRAKPMVYGGSQTRDSIRTVATSLHHSHSNWGSESRLQPTPRLMATPDP